MRKDIHCCFSEYPSCRSTRVLFPGTFGGYSSCRPARDGGGDKLHPVALPTRRG
ncbi:MAG: hypothetical protein LBF09_05620 [Odoribacteraceae bacterium]|nr:hypothetical protein [Odoribacteraceae bacterium]